MKLSFVDIIKAEDINASETSVSADDNTNKKSGADETAVSVSRGSRAKQSKDLNEMASIPKIPRQHHRTARTTTAVENEDVNSTNDTTTEVNSQVAQNVITEESGTIAMVETPKIHDLPHIPESPNIIETEKTETTADHLTGSLSRDFRHFFEENSIEEQFPMAPPLLIGGLIGIPAFLTIRNIRRRGLVNYLTKAPVKTKLFQLLVLGTGVAAGASYFKEPRKPKYEKDFKDA